MIINDTGSDSTGTLDLWLGKRPRTAPPPTPLLLNTVRAYLRCTDLDRWSALPSARDALASALVELHRDSPEGLELLLHDVQLLLRAVLTAPEGQASGLPLEEALELYRRVACAHEERLLRGPLTFRLAADGIEENHALDVRERPLSILEWMLDLLRRELRADLAELVAPTDDLRSVTVRACVDSSGAARILDVDPIPLEVGAFDAFVAGVPGPVVLDAQTRKSFTVGSRARVRNIEVLVGMRLCVRDAWVGTIHLGYQGRVTPGPAELGLLERLGPRVAAHVPQALAHADCRRKLAQLEYEAHLKEQFVNMLAHDLRGPLSVTRMAAQSLGKRTPRNDAIQRLVGRVVSGTGEMDSMVRDLLDIMRVRSGHPLPVQFSALDLGLLAQETVEALQVVFGSRFVMQQREVRPGFWDARHLRRAIWNLGSNAAKYGDRTAPITLRLWESEANVHLSMHNHGNPIPPERQQELFEPFHQLDTRLAGWGIGLALVRACAEAHGGQVRVESTVLLGTTFTLSLPRGTPAEAAPA
jgi:signal transduction histidine kinase